VSDIALPDGLPVLLKTASRALVNACAAPGQTGPQRVEAMTGYSAGQISKWQSENDPALMPIHVVAILEAATGQPVFSRTLASLSGHQLVPVAHPNEEEFCLMRSVVATTASQGRFAAQAMDALADQKLTRGEFKGLLATALRNQEELGELVRRLAERAGE
jgi:hypothetical protein